MADHFPSIKSRKDRKIKDLVDWARRRARRDGREFDMVVTDITWPSRCPCCGGKLTYGKTGEDRRTNLSASLDRINPLQGYIKGNVQVLCWRCNAIKRDATLPELKRMVRFLELFYY